MEKNKSWMGVVALLLILGVVVVVVSVSLFKHYLLPAMVGITKAVQERTCTTVEITHSLARGSTDAETDGDVSELQQYLRVWGDKYQVNGVKDLPITGTYGPQTEAAVRSFQDLHNLPANTEEDTAVTVPFSNSDYGVVGPRTRALLKKSCIEGGFSEGYEDPATTPFVTLLTPMKGTHKLSEPLTLQVAVATTTYRGTVEVYLVRAEDNIPHYTGDEIRIALTDQLRDGYSGILTYTITDFDLGTLGGSGNPPHHVVPGDYVIHIQGYDGSSSNGREMEDRSEVFTFVE